MREYYTPQEVADTLRYLDIDEIYRRLKDGRIPGFKVGNRWRIPSKEFHALMRKVESGEVIL